MSHMFCIDKLTKKTKPKQPNKKPKNSPIKTPYPYPKNTDKMEELKYLHLFKF